MYYAYEHTQTHSHTIRAHTDAFTQNPSASTRPTHGGGGRCIRVKHEARKQHEPRQEREACEAREEHHVRSAGSVCAFPQTSS